MGRQKVETQKNANKLTAKISVEGISNGSRLDRPKRPTRLSRVGIKVGGTSPSL